MLWRECLASPIMIAEPRISQRVPLDQAIRISREIYGLEVQAQSLPGEYDHNFQVTTADGRAFVLKVMHPGRERSFLELKCQALQHLASRSPGLTVPRIQLTRSGEPFTKITMQDGEEHFVWLLSFLEGRVLAETNPHSGELLENLGQLLGEIDHCLEDFSHPAAR